MTSPRTLRVIPCQWVKEFLCCLLTPSGWFAVSDVFHSHFLSPGLPPSAPIALSPLFPRAFCLLLCAGSFAMLHFEISRGNRSLLGFSPAFACSLARVIYRACGVNGIPGFSSWIIWSSSGDELAEDGFWRMFERYNKVQQDFPTMNGMVLSWLVGYGYMKSS